MPKPEIARRCPSCGVSIRVRASFCPQCGHQLNRKAGAPPKVKDGDTLTTGFGTPGPAVSTPTSAVTMPLSSEQTGSQPTVVSASSKATRKQPMQATIGMVEHAGPPSREVFAENEVNRVEKFRQISSSVIGGAAYDPGLRFVIVAAVLFLLFLLLLLLSELI